MNKGWVNKDAMQLKKLNFSAKRTTFTALDA